MDRATRSAINESSVRTFFATWDPCWRWVLLLGMRDLRANLDRLGALAEHETGRPEWQADEYLYGPVVHGITAAAVSEVAQYCEDLFALLTFLRDGSDFVKRMTSYSAGQVTNLAVPLEQESDATIRTRFLFPKDETVRSGLVTGADPPPDTALIDEGVAHLGALVREVASWYLTYEFFHNQYKHGLKHPMRPFGVPPATTLNERRSHLRGPLIAYTNEPLAGTLRRPPPLHTISYPDPGDLARAHIPELIKERQLLSYQMSGPEVDLDDLVALSWNIARLLRIAGANRLSVSNGLDGGSQEFQLPGEKTIDTLVVRLAISKPVTLADFPK